MEKGKVKLEIEEQYDRQYKELLSKTMFEKQLFIKQAMMLQNQIIAELQAEKDRQNESVVVQVPKSDFDDWLLEYPNSVPLGELDTVLEGKTCSVELFEILRDKNILDERNKLYQKYIDLGYFRIIEYSTVMDDGTQCITRIPIVLPTGIDFVRQCLK